MRIGSGTPVSQPYGHKLSLAFFFEHSIGVAIEIMGGRPNPIGGVRNEVFAQPLVGYRKCGKSFTEGEKKREMKGQITAVLRPV